MSGGQGAETRGVFYAVLFYLFVEYGRPQDVVPIGFMKPGMVATVILTVLLLRKGAASLRLTPQVKYVLALVALLATYIPFAENNYFAYATTRDMLMYVPFMLGVIVSVDSLDRLRTLITFIVGITVYIGGHAIVHAGVGSGSYFSDENDLSLFVNMWIPFCFFLLAVEPNRLRKVLYAVGLATAIVANVVSRSRGGFLGLLGVGVAMWLMSPRKALTLVLVLALALGVYVFAGTAYLEEMGTVADTQEGTAAARLWSWKAAWDMFLDHPLGVGGNNFQVKFPYYQPEFFQRGMWGRVAHSLWFTLLPELGIGGVILYALLLWRNLKDVLAMRRNRLMHDGQGRYLKFLSCAFAASLAGFFASGTFLSVLYYAHYWYLTAIISAAALIGASGRDRGAGALEAAANPAGATDASSCAHAGRSSLTEVTKSGRVPASSAGVFRDVSLRYLMRAKFLPSSGEPLSWRT